MRKKSDINGSFNKLLGEVRKESDSLEEQEDLLTEKVLKELILFYIAEKFKKEQSVCFPHYIPKKKRTPVERKSPEKKRCFEGEFSTIAEERETKKAKKDQKNKNKEKDSAVAPTELPEKIREAKKKEKESAPVPELPEKLKNMIEGKNGSDIKLVIQKSLFKTDMSDGHNRLSIPLGKVNLKFLSESEKKTLDDRKAIIVPMIEPCLEESVDRLRLKKWHMGKASSLALITGWNDVKSKKKNGLEIDVQVQLWSYRIKEQLCFALVKVEDSGAKAMVLGQVPVVPMAHEQADSYRNT